VDYIRVRAIVLREFGKPFIMEEIDIGDASPGDVVVRVRAVGICGRDLVVWRGGFRNLKPPLVLGHEVYGELEGRPVGVYSNVYCGKCRYCLSGKENLCDSASLLGETRYGGYAQYLIIRRDNLVTLPDNEYEKYAATICPVATVIHASRLIGMRGSSRVLVTGAGGGVGIHAIQYLKAAGNYVIAVTSPRKADSVSRYADEVVTDEAFSGKVRDVDVVFEMVGARTINESLRSLKKEGVLVLVGNVTGEEVILKRPALTIMREHRIIGTAAYTMSEYKEAIELVSRGVIKPHYVTYRMSDVNRAYDDLANSRVLGRAVIMMD